MDSGPPTRPLLPASGVAAGELLAGRYRLEQLIGRGGMAEVFAAYDEVLDRRVAVKVFPTPAPGGADAGAGEVRLLASLSHPGLVTVHDAGTATVDDEGPAFLVMELISGPSLAQQLLHGPLQPAQVRVVGGQIAAALAYVHRRGLIHRDVKPGNILLVEPLGDPGAPVHAKLADFGIARLMDATRATLTGTALGTASYLSPEQVRGERVGPPSDVYALGLAMLEALTAHVVYPGTAVESAVARLHRAPDIPSDLAPELADLLRAMTDPDPAQRPRADRVAQALDAPAPTVGGTHTSAHPSGDARSDPPPDRAAAMTMYASPWRRWTTLPRRTRATALAAVGAAVVTLVAILSLTQVSAPSHASTAVQHPSYPSVPGRLGVDLHRLQKAVQP